MIYKEKFKPGLKDIGKDNKIKNRALLEYLENIASYHSDMVGYGANDTENTKSAWVLLDWKLQVITRPKYGEILNIHTWAKGMNKFFTCRDFEIYNENNELCAIATSKWALIDITNGKMIRLTEKIMDRYEAEEKNVFLDENLGKIKEPEEFISSIEYRVIRKDIDINQHMHNLYYLELAYEALPEEVYNQRPFDNVRITYKKEVKLGETVECKYTKIEDKHIIVIKSQDEKITHAIIELKKIVKN